MLLFLSKSGLKIQKAARVVNTCIEVKVSISFNYLLSSSNLQTSSTCQILLQKKKVKETDGVCFMCLTRALKSSTRSQAMSTSFSDPSASQLQLTSTYCFPSFHSTAQKIKQSLSDSFCLFVLFPLCSLIHSPVLPII